MQHKNSTFLFNNTIIYMQIYHQNSNVFSCFNGPFAAERSHGAESPNGRANENKENSNVKKLILLYNLGVPPLRKTVSPHVKNDDNFSRFWDQLVTCHLLYLVPSMNDNAFSFWKVNEVSLFLLVRCLCNEQNNTWFLGDMEFLFLCAT